MKDIDDIIVKHIHSLVKVVNKDKECLEPQKITTVAHLIQDLKPNTSIPSFLQLVEETVYMFDQSLKTYEPCGMVGCVNRTIWRCTICGHFYCDEHKKLHFHEKCTPIH